MAKLKKTLTFALAVAIGCTLMYPVGVFAALGDMAVSSKAQQEVYYRMDFADWDGTIIGKGHYIPTNADFTGLSTKGEGFTEYLTKSANGYARATTFWLKLPTFFYDAEPGICTVKFKARALNPTTDGKSTGKLTAKIYNMADSVNNNTWKWSATNMSACMPYDSEWQEATLTYNFDGNVTELGDTIDSGALMLYFAGAEVGTSGKFVDYEYEYIEVSCVRKSTLSEYAGGNLNLTTTVYNNSDSPKDARLITALYDSEGRLNPAYGINEQPVGLDANSRADYEWVIPVPAEADDTWKLKTYLWSTDGKIEAYCDALTEFTRFNTNPELEILSSDTTTGLLGWEAVGDSGAAVTDGSYAGKYAMSITNGASQSIDDVISTYGSGSYKLTLAARSAAASKLEVSCASSQKSFTTGSDWQEYTFEFTIPSTVKEADIKLTNASGSEIIADDIILTKVYK